MKPVTEITKHYFWRWKMLCLAASPAICCPFLPPFQFYSICAVIHFGGCTRAGLCLTRSCVWPLHLLHLSVSMGYHTGSHQSSSMRKGNLKDRKNCLNWRWIGCRISSCEWRWFSTNQLWWEHAVFFALLWQWRCTTATMAQAGASLYAMTANCVRCCAVVLWCGFP